MKNKLFEIVSFLAIKKIETSIKLDAETNLFFIDMNTQAKSDMYLYEDGTVQGRYNILDSLNLEEDTSTLVRYLCFCFKECLCGRNYYNQDWANLCKEHGIVILK